MSGPFTTITVRQYHLMLDVIRKCDQANLGHGVGCPFVWNDPKPCICGLRELEEALGVWGQFGAH